MKREEEKRLNDERATAEDNFEKKLEEAQNSSLLEGSSNSSNQQKKLSSFFRNPFRRNSQDVISTPGYQNLYDFHKATLDSEVYERLKGLCIKLFRRDINLVEGTYRMFIAAHSEKDTPISAWEVEFQLYEKTIEDLLSDFENYKTGNFNERPNRVILRAQKVNTTAEDSLNDYKELLEA